MSRMASEVSPGEISRLLAERGVNMIPETALTQGPELSKGRFKTVRQGSLKMGDTSRDVVVLRFAQQKSELKELDILAFLGGSPASKPFAPEVYGACNVRKATIIVQERAEWGSLKAVVMSEEAAPFWTTGNKVKSIALGARAMDYLSQVHIVHADLSCRNFLVYSLDHDPQKLQLKVTDFGLAAIVPEGASGITKKQPQATRWCSPEMVAYSWLSHAGDVWALAATMWEMFAGGAAPWPKREKRAMVGDRLRDLADTGGQAEGGEDVSSDFPIQEGCPQEAHDAMLACFRAKPEDRPTFLQFANRLDRILQPLKSVEEKVLDAGSAATTTCTSEEPAHGLDMKWMEVSKSPQSRPTFLGLSDFLSSAYAAEVLGEEALQAMRMEYEDAKAQQMYLRDLVDRQLGSEAAASSGQRRQDMLVQYEPPVSQNQNPNSSWTVWSFSKGALRRQDFWNEREAREAFVAIVGPGVLRDPQGRDVVSRSWTTLQPTYLR